MLKWGTIDPALVPKLEAIHLSIEDAQAALTPYNERMATGECWRPSWRVTEKLTFFFDEDKIARYEGGGRWEPNGSGAGFWSCVPWPGYQDVDAGFIDALDELSHGDPAAMDKWLGMQGRKGDIDGQKFS